MFDKFIHKTLSVPYKLHVAFDKRPKGIERNTLVFLHGVAASSHTWDELLKIIKQDPTFESVRLIGIDLLGFGKSASPKWNKFAVRDQVRAIHRTLGGLFITGPITIVGHSMGALLATEYTARYNSAKQLVLVSPPFMTPKEQRIPSDVLYAAMLDNLKKAAGSKGGKKVAGVVEKFSNFEAKYAKSPAFRRSMDNVVLKGHAWDEVKRLNIPVLLVNGTFDSIVSRANLLKLAKYAHISLAESANGHSVSPRRSPFIVEEIKKALES
ncbi:MAG: alpha/beta hydrolase [Candidatus Nomurabacteria bacterium]|jgi:pimeloyl-ACP methyl ester carboxylesterase|nr:alpha/beta hydrolase [Candidatus Nomurabacteria bacterium]